MKIKKNTLTLLKRHSNVKRYDKYDGRIWLLREMIGDRGPGEYDQPIRTLVANTALAAGMASRYPQNFGASLSCGLNEGWIIDLDKLVKAILAETDREAPT